MEVIRVYSGDRDNPGPIKVRKIIYPNYIRSIEECPDTDRRCALIYGDERFLIDEGYDSFTKRLEVERLTSDIMSID